MPFRVSVLILQAPLYIFDKPKQQLVRETVTVKERKRIWERDHSSSLDIFLAPLTTHANTGTPYIVP